MAMAMLDGRKPTPRNLAAAPEARPSPRRRAPAPAAFAVATSSTPPPVAPLSCGGKASDKVCRFNPDLIAGILAAFVAPAAARLRVAQPTRAGARGILDVTSSAGSCCGRRRPPFRVAEFMLACNLCCRQIGGDHLYMYKGEMAFCSPECRHDYSLQNLQRERRRRRLARTQVPTRATRGDAKGDDGEASIFFIFAENNL